MKALTGVPGSKQYYVMEWDIVEKTKLVLFVIAALARLTFAAQDWDSNQDGWIVFIDNNFDGTVDVSDEVLRVHSGLAAGNTLRFTQAKIVYANTGLARTGSNGIFIHCDSRGSQYARGLIVGPSGRARLFTEEDFRDVIEDNADIERFLCA